MKKSVARLRVTLDIECPYCLGDNNLDGQLPSVTWTLQSLAYLFLYDNSFSGELPIELGNLINLKTLDYFGMVKKEKPPKS